MDYSEGLLYPGFAIIPNGIKYNPSPKVIEVIETLIQFSFTIPEAINTVPHTGGVMVDNNANQKMNKCTNSISSPISTNAGPATETHIIYAAVVGTSIPRIKHAKAVKVMLTKGYYQNMKLSMM